MDIIAFLSRLRLLAVSFTMRRSIAVLCVIPLLAACTQGVVDPSGVASPLPMDTPIPATETAVPATATPAATEIPEATEIPAATETMPPASESPAAKEIPAGLVIDPENATNLQQAAQLNETGAQDFSWLEGGESIALSMEAGVSVFKVDPVEETAQVPAETPALITVSPDQQTVAWVSAESTIQVMNVTGGDAVQTLEGNTAIVTSLAFSPDGGTLAASNHENAVMLWDLSSGQLLDTWELPYWFSNLSFSPDGTLLAGVDPENFAVHIWEVASGEEQRSLSWTEHASPVLYGAFFSPDWQTLAWVARGTVQLMDAASGELGLTLSHEDFVNDIDWSPDGSLLATAAAGTVDDEFSPVVIVWEVETGQALSTLTQPEPVLSVAFAPDGSRLASLVFGGTVQLWAVPEQ